MKTTIRIADDHGDRLRELAAARGDKGVSRIVEEAVAFYLAEKNRPVPIPAPPPPPAPPPGRWQTVGALIDRSWRERSALTAMAMRLVRVRLGRLSARA